MKVKFDKYGFYHPAFGRMGRGKEAGDIYDLPDIFAADGMLPKTAVILDEVSADELEEMLEDQGQRRAHKPKVLDEEQLAKAKKRAAKKPAGKKAAAK